MSNSDHLSSQDLQHAFAAHIRDPEHQAVPAGIEDRRMGIYRDLFFNNVENFCASTFPILKELTCADDWQALIRRFYIEKPCHSPLFRDIPFAFLEFLQDAVYQDDDFRLELAHYEWLEMAIAVAEDQELDPNLDPKADLMHNTIVLSPYQQLCQYHYSVHKMQLGDSHPDEITGPFFVLVYRDLGDDVNFLSLTPLSARLFQLLNEQELSVKNVTKILATELKQDDTSQLESQVRDEIERARRLGLVIGGIKM